MQTAFNQDLKALIFDLGGVILRTEDANPRLTLAKRYGISRAELETRVFGHPTAQAAEAGQASEAEVWAAIAESFGLQPREVRPFRRKFFGGDRVDQPLLQIMRRLHYTYKLGLLSNTWVTDLPNFLLKNFQIETELFDVIVSSAACGMVKPHAPVFEHTLKLLGVDASEALFIDDNADNIAGAQAAGLRTFWFQSPATARRILSTLIPQSMPLDEE